MSDPMTTISQATDRYLDSVHLARSANTARTYRNALSAFFDVLTEKRILPDETPVQELSEDAIIWFAAALKRIKKNPFQGPKYLELTDEFPSLRRCQALPYRNYLVFYDLTEDDIRILYVFEASRDIPERIREQQRI